MKNLLKKWNDTSLILRIILGLTAGILLALTMPQITVISILGTLFVNALKAIAPVLVFILVISSLAQAANGIGKRFRTVIFLYMLSTFLASVTAVFASYVFPVTLKLTEAVTDQIPPSGIMEVFHNLLNNIVSNPIAALMNGNYIGILAWSVILGLALKELASEQTKLLLKDLSEAVSQTVRWIINFAPIGILGLVFTSVSENGITIFIDYSRLLALLVGCMLMIALIINPLIVAICLHRNPYPLVYRCFKESGVTAFFTRSSAANIPVNMALCERLGLDKNIYSVSIPLGATINMNGAAITITVMTLAAAHTMGISVHISTAILLSLLSTLAACGASGVAGGSLLLIPMACSLLASATILQCRLSALALLLVLYRIPLKRQLIQPEMCYLLQQQSFVNGLRKAAK